MVKESVRVWVYDRINKKQRQISLSMPSTSRDRKKTRRAFFANFMNQKDASLANFIIKMSEGMHLYTVHDNFIVHPSKASHVTHCYTSAFQTLGDPISQVNLFMFNNIISYSTLGQELTTLDLASHVTFIQDWGATNTESTFQSKECAKSLLHLLSGALSDLEPTNLERNEKKSLDVKRDMLLTSYSSYVNYLEGTENVGYAPRYKGFQEQLLYNASCFALHP